MRKSKKIIIYVSALTLLSSGIKYIVVKERNHFYNNYINKTAHDSSNDDILISAHRGFSSINVENTKEAITLASSKEYIDYIEIDIRLTDDNIIILSHDNIVYDNDTSYNLSNLSYQEISNTTFLYHKNTVKSSFWDNPESIMINNRNKNLDGKEYYIISLNDALIYAKDKLLLLDLKFNNNIEVFTEKLINIFQNIDTNNIIFQSFNISGIKYLQDHSNFTCQVLISKEDDLKYVDDFTRIGLNFSIINYDLINNLIRSNKKVALWTINNSNDLNYVLERVGKYYQDIIYITDYPDLIACKLHEKVLKK